MGGITDMSLPDHLDDLTVEEAQWFYEDFIRPAAAAAGNPLPSLTLRQFCLALFQHCPLLKGFSDEMHIAAYEEFLAYKVRVPVRGAILMSEDMERLVLVKGWKKGASWSFPRGKINKDEKDLDCAIREVYEETGYDVRQAGLVPDNENAVKAIDVTMREQHMKLFVFRGVKEDTYFEPKTRKEISKIQWYNVKDLPGFKRQKNGDAQYANKFYMVAPFLSQLKKWIKEQRQNDARVLKTESPQHVQLVMEDEDTTEIATDPIVDKAEELRRLLMIPGPQQGGIQAASQIPSHLHPHIAQQTQASDLLALLSGRTQPPSTQQVQHKMYLSMHQRDSHAQTLGGINQMDQHHQQGAVHGISQTGSSRPPQLSIWGGQESDHAIAAGKPVQAPAFNPRFFQGPHQNQMQERASASQQQQAATHLQQSWPAHQQTHGTVGPQGLHGAIAAGPSAPKAENLPVPKMNAHAMKLLGAFKGPAQASSIAPIKQAEPSLQQARTQQDALLGLLKQGKGHQASPRPTEQEAVGKVDTSSDPAVLQRRKSALNEITRTLPIKGIKSPSPVPLTTEPGLKGTREPRRSANDVGLSRQKISKLERPQQSPRTILQRPGSSNSRQNIQGSPSSPQTNPAAHTGRHSAVPKINDIATKAASATGTPQMKSFTILARPGSRPGSGSGSGLETDRLRDATQAQNAPLDLGISTVGKPQAQAAAVKDDNPTRDVADNGLSGAAKEEDKKEQLLALFGRKDKLSQGGLLPSILKSTSQSAPATNSGLSPSVRSTGSRVHIGQQPATTIAPPTSGINPTPVGNGGVPNGSNADANKQKALLDLFAKSASVAAPHPKLSPDTRPEYDNPLPPAAAPSPSTPSSPFVLGTPSRTLMPGLIGGPHHLRSVVSPTSDADTMLSRPSSTNARDVSSPVSASGWSNTGPAAATAAATPTLSPTPTEAKGFLLNYLNGVVQKEGLRGNPAKR